MDRIYEIIERKKQGIDCTEAESAEIKSWLRELKLPFEQPTVSDIQYYFTQEYSEFLDEIEPNEPEKVEELEKIEPRKPNKQIRYKIWVEIERIEIDPETGSEEYFDEDNPIGIAYRDNIEDAVEMQNLINNTFGEIM